MTAEEILDKHLIKHVSKEQKKMILAAMEEHGKLVHKKARYKAIDLLLDNVSKSKVYITSLIQNMPYPQ